VIKNQLRKNNRDMRLNPALVKSRNRFVIKKSRVSGNVTQTAWSNELKTAVKVESTL